MTAPFDWLAATDPAAAALRDHAISAITDPLLEALDMEQRWTRVEIEHAKTLHPSSIGLVSFDQLRPGMGFHRPDGVWIVVTKRSDGLMLCRREDDGAEDWVDAAGGPWPQAAPF